MIMSAKIHEIEMIGKVVTPLKSKSYDSWQTRLVTLALENSAILPEDFPKKLKSTKKLFDNGLTINEAFAQLFPT